MLSLCLAVKNWKKNTSLNFLYRALVESFFFKYQLVAFKCPKLKKKHNCNKNNNNDKINHSNNKNSNKIDNNNDNLEKNDNNNQLNLMSLTWFV